MARQVASSKYSRDAHKDRVLQLHCMTHLRRSDVYGGMYLYVCAVKYFVLIIWWLTIFNKCIFDVANVGRWFL